MKKILYKTMALGAFSGMRSMAGPTLVSHFVCKDKNSPLKHTPLRLLGNENVALLLKGLAGGELVGDKLPSAPDRIAAPSLVVRGASGALVGAAVYLMHDGKGLHGAFVGATAAIGATFASFYLRKYLSEHTSLADPILGALEDALVVGGGLKAAQL
ncbi:DUF4126 family protein [Pontibacter sp. E15-1]|uniref:DUF4126 family protein n=1 Tax=Pontibacter sp. E15-1 TaxID=2919918 RepID=UPI001F4F172B|nr:DUF4126 family protein [Pontibacter sp. E15-1]MCJ8165080.1 DUF4126 family protein [Pontibacter sp. E15-1]